MCHDSEGWFRSARKVETAKDALPSDDSLVSVPPQPVPPLKTHEPPTKTDEREKLPV